MEGVKLASSIMIIFNAENFWGAQTCLNKPYSLDLHRAPSKGETNKYGSSSINEFWTGKKRMFQNLKKMALHTDLSSYYMVLVLYIGSIVITISPKNPLQIFQV